MKRRHRLRRNGADRTRPPAEDADIQAPPNRGNCTQPRRLFLARRLAAIVAGAILSIAFVPRAAFSQTSPTDHDGIPLELAAMDKRGGVIARVREQVLVMLQSENACTAWFREADPDPAGVFRSLHYEVEKQEPSYVLHTKDARGEGLFKHPWAAHATEYAGRDALIGLNPNGAFFTSASPLMELESRGMVPRLGGYHALAVGPFSGNSVAAQITILLHELGHIVGRLPEDSDSLDGQSSRNTEELLRHCKHEVRAAAQSSSRSSN